MSQQEYDVVIVGSGIGGLGAGALLSHWGFNTLVLEKLSLIGGRCSTEDVEGFKLPTGAMTLTTADIEDIFTEVGCEVELVRVPELVWRVAGRDCEMPPKGAVSAILNIINQLEEEKAKELGRAAELVPVEVILNAFQAAFKEPELVTGLNFKDWLTQYTDNEMIHDVFNAMMNAIPGTPYFELPATAAFAWFTVMGGSREMGFPPRGNIVNMEMLAQVVRANGDVRVDRPVKRILVTNKEARGVIVEENGKEVEIHCKVVISDIGPRNTVELAGRDNYDEDYMRAVRLTHKPKASCHCFIASDRPLWPESGEPAVLMIAGARRLQAVIPLSSISPYYAPSGQHVMFCLAPAVTNEARMNADVEVEQLLLDLKEQFPLFEKHGRVLKMVVKNIDDDLPTIRTQVNDMMPNETPIKNLYDVGDATCSYGLCGATGAAETGKRVARMVRDNYRPL